MCSANFRNTKLGRNLIAKSQARKAALVAQNQQSAEPSAGAAQRQVGVRSRRAPESSSLIAGSGNTPAQTQGTLLGG